MQVVDVIDTRHFQKITLHFLKTFSYPTDCRYTTCATLIREGTPPKVARV